jgi:nitrogen fixation/metabolism regulation signal transduction histidine kinase
VFQAKFIFAFLLLVIIGSIISGIILYTKANTYLGYEYGKAHIKLEKTGEILQPALFISYGIGVVLIGFATIILTIFISHKIAGPLYRFERSAEEIGKGNLTLVTQLRESDQAKDLANAFSRMTKDLRKKLLEIDTRTKELNQIVDELNTVVQGKSPNIKEIQDKFKNLKQMSNSLLQSLQFFKL